MVKVVIPYRKVYKGILFLTDMPIKIKKLSEVIGKRVYTDHGDFFGDIEEVNVVENKVDSWRIKVAGGIGSFLGGARGVVVPHQFVKAIGDVCLISRASLPIEEEVDELPEEEIEL